MRSNETYVQHRTATISGSGPADDPYEVSMISNVSEIRGADEGMLTIGKFC